MLTHTSSFVFIFAVDKHCILFVCGACCSRAIFLNEGKFVHMHQPVKMEVIVYTILVPLIIGVTVILHIPVFVM